MAKAAVAAGADGLLVEVHACPDDALSDGTQSLRPDQFMTMMNELRPVAIAVGRDISAAKPQSAIVEKRAAVQERAPTAVML